MEHLQLERDGAVAVVTVNRPQAMNALNVAAILELDALFADLEQDNSVGAVIVTGAGEKSFVAGADIEEIRDLDLVSGKDFAARGLGLYSRIEKLHVPVIAAVNGYALGGGCELAMACHLRLASETAKFGQPEVNLGIIPGYGGTQRLARLVGRGRALDLLLTGRMISAAEAKEWGLVNQVIPPAELLPAARKLAVDLAAKPKLAVMAILEAVDAGLQLGLDQALQVEENLFAYCCGTKDKNEGTSAFLEKRKAGIQGTLTALADLYIHNIGLLATPRFAERDTQQRPVHQIPRAAILIQNGRVTRLARKPRLRRACRRAFRAMTQRAGWRCRDSSTATRIPCLWATARTSFICATRARPTWKSPPRAAGFRRPPPRCGKRPASRSSPNRCRVSRARCAAA